MVYLIHNCHCESCPGSRPAPRTESGEMVFGGSICNCRCHDLKGIERDEFIKMKNGLETETTR